MRLRDFTELAWCTAVSFMAAAAGDQLIFDEMAARSEAVRARVKARKAALR